MRTIDKYDNQDDEFFHPLWLGILLLFSVMIIIGLLCCLRIKYGTHLRILFNRLCGRKNKKTDNSSMDDKSSTISYSYNWPPIYTTSRSHSPKLYTLVRNLRNAKLEKQLSVRQQNSYDDENETHPRTESDPPQLSVTLLTDDGTRASEIARKFYASMRNTSQCQNSSSLDSYNNDPSLAGSNPSSITDQPITSKREQRIKSFRTTRFFKSMPNTDGVNVII